MQTHFQDGGFSKRQELLNEVAIAIATGGDWQTPARRLCIVAAYRYLCSTRGSAVAASCAEDLGADLFAGFRRRAAEDVPAALERWLRSRGRLHDAASAVVDTVYVHHGETHRRGSRSYSCSDEVLDYSIDEHDDTRTDADIAEITRAVERMTPNQFRRTAIELFGAQIMNNPSYIKTLRRKVIEAALAKRETLRNRSIDTSEIQRRSDELSAAQAQLTREQESSEKPAA